MNVTKKLQLRNIEPLDLLAFLNSVSQEVAYFETGELSGESFVRKKTILAAKPLNLIKFDGGVNPFTSIAETFAETKAKDLLSIGHISYDSVRYLEPQLKNLGDFSPSAHAPDGIAMFFEEYLVLEHASNTATLFSNGSDFLESLLESFQISTSDPKLKDHCSPERQLALEHQMGERKFKDGVLNLKEHIRQGDIFQAVLSEKFSTPYDGDPVALFARLIRINPSPYRFYISDGIRTVLGTSPEMLLKIEDRKLETHPIAGTRPRGSNVREEKRFETQLRRSVKENAEHLMLVDLARNDLGKVALPGSVHVESLKEIRKFGAVMHLVSKVKGVLDPIYHSFEALAACFPAGTLSGAPKIRAMEILSEIESQPRGFYGGAVFVADSSGNLDSCISIRSIEILNGIASIQAGAGIVYDSNPEREYEEILNKTTSARKALGATV